MSAYDDGKAAYAAETHRSKNPFSKGTDNSDWAAGWSDAQAEGTTEGTGPQPTATDESSGEPGSSAPAGTPNANEADSSLEEPEATDAVASLGDVGFDRIMELLSNPPIDDMPDGGASLPPGGDVPDDLGDWLEAWKAPLAFVTVDTAINAVKTRIGGTSRGRLKELYRSMSPQAMTAAMRANADTIMEFADQRATEAALINSLQVSVTQRAAGFLLNALLLV